MKRQVVVRVLLGVLAVLLLAGLILEFTPALNALRSPASPTALTVNGQPVTVQTLESIKKGNPVLALTPGGTLGDDFRTVVVQQAVNQALFDQASKSENVSRSVVNAEVDRIRQAQNLTDTKAWTEALQGAGLSDSTFRDFTRTRLAIERKAKAIQDGAPKPTAAQEQLYYQLNPQTYQSDARIVAREISVAGKAQADTLLAQLKGGADFAALAAASSLDNKDRGGALAPLENGAPRPVAQVALPQEVGVAAFALTNGGLTDVVKSGDRYYIVKVEKFLPPATRPFSEVRTSVTGAVQDELKNQALESWIDGLQKNAAVKVTDPAWSYSNPTVATVDGASIPYSDVLNAMVGNQQFASLLQQAPGAQAAQLVNSFLKPSIVQGLIQQYAAPIVVKAQNLALVGNRQEQLAGLAAYGARNVSVSGADIQAAYAANQKDYQLPGSATVSEASFPNRTAALAFREDYRGGDFTAAAGRAGATVSERGQVQQGDSKLAAPVAAAVFAGGPLQAAGEGSLSGVAANGGRFVVAYVADLVKPSVKPLSDVSGTIRTALLAQKKQSAGQAYVQQQLKGVKTDDLLSQVLAAQTRRVAAATPSTPSAAAGTPSAPAGTTPAGTAPSTPSAP